MTRPLYPYYERELTYLRQSAREFSRQYPATAGGLMLDMGRSADPHVERLLEGAALLAGRIRHKLDDEFPELSQGLLSVLYPHLLAPIPSMAVAQFEADPGRVNMPGGYSLPVGTRLHTQPVAGLRCRFRTCSPVTLWPLVVRQASWRSPPFPSGVQAPPRTAAMLHLELETRAGATFADLRLDQLRFHLATDAQVVPLLLEYLLNEATQIHFQDPDSLDDNPLFVRPASRHLAPGGFNEDDGLLPYPAHALPGYRLLTDYFAFQQKFWFVDLIDLGSLERVRGRRLHVDIFFPQNIRGLEQSIDANTFRLGCTPVVNLFDQTAEPIPVTHRQTEYPVIPSVNHPQGMEVYSVQSVSLTSPTPGNSIDFEPFYAIRYGSFQDRKAFWHASRQASVSANDRGTDVMLSLVDSGFDPYAPADGVLVVKTLCSNRDYPERLRQSGKPVQLEPEQAVPVSRIGCLHGPTTPLRAFGRRSFWQLISHLNLGHLGLSGSTDATASLQGVLSLYDLTDTDSGDPRAQSARLAIDGIRQLKTRPVMQRLGKLTKGGFCRGLEIDLELDEEKFIGVGAFLFASVLERYFALQTSANSFTQLVVRTRSGGEPLKKWPPRSGDLPLL